MWRILDFLLYQMKYLSGGVQAAKTQVFLFIHNVLIYNVIKDSQTVPLVLLEVNFTMIQGLDCLMIQEGHKE